VKLAGGGVDAVRREIQERMPGHAEAVREQRRVPSVVAAQPLDDHVRHREDGGEERDDESDRQEREDDYDDEDRQRRAHQEPEEHDGPDLDGAERPSGREAGHECVLLELLGG
jgi:hypothetical protein